LLSTIRITFGPENTIADAEAILAALKLALRKGCSGAHGKEDVDN